MFESDKEDEGIIVNINVNVVSQHIVSYFKSLSDYGFSSVH